jgi:hypothetical protein
MNVRGECGAHTYEAFVYRNRAALSVDILERCLSFGQGRRDCPTISRKHKCRLGCGAAIRFYGTGHRNPTWRTRDEDLSGDDDRRLSIQPLIAIDGQSLSLAPAAQQDRKLAEEIDRRRNESLSARQKRIALYQQEREQNYALMAEMAKAFDFKLTGEDIVNGRQCFVLDATPKAGYTAPNRETKVLTGMRGTMWVDTHAYQWVKVHAEVFRPVTFGLFFARVKPGTEFTLEEKPVVGNLWLPSHFSMSVQARVLFASRRSTDDETYSNYRPATGLSGDRTGLGRKQ